MATSRILLGLSLAAVLAAPLAASAQDLKDDDLNGLWLTTLDGKKLSSDAMTESWPEIGVRLRLNGDISKLKREQNTLVSDSSNVGFDDVLGKVLGATTGDGSTPAIKLDIQGGDSIPDTVLTGTYLGKSITMTRDTSVKPPIVIKLPGDRPWMRFQTEILEPAANQDRESYEVLNAKDVRTFLQNCELYNYWQKKYIKGATPAEKAKNFDSIITAVDGLKTTPRLILRESKFTNAVQSVLADPTKAGLALSSLGMYFSTGGGRAVRLMITDDSKAYFITDRPTRAGKIGLCVMWTPTHKPLASTFGRVLLDCGKMPSGDDDPFWHTVVSVLAKADCSGAQKLSGLGRSVMTDYIAVMAIEHYRDIAFQNPDEEWGYNMTNVMFFSRVVRALGGQVIIDDGSGKPTLNPGDPSYADVLNGGNDMQELEGMATLKQLTTKWLRDKHADLADKLDASLAKIVPAADVSDRAQQDIFHRMCQAFYDARIAKLSAADLAGIAKDCDAVLDVIGSDSKDLEAYILANGVTKSTTPAPQATGF